MLYSVQFLRGFAALLVVLSHVVNKEVQYGICRDVNNGICEDYWFNVGGVGVDLFFIISGFIMCYTTYNKEMSLLRFIKLRIERIIPLYWLFTTIALIAFLSPLRSLMANPDQIAILDSYFLLPLGKSYLVGTGWTLSYEFYFYFIFSLFLVFPIKSYPRYVYIILMITILVCFGWVVDEQSLIMEFIFNHWLLEFALGMVSFLFFKHIKFSPLCCIVMIIASILILFYHNMDDFLLRSSYRAFYAGIPMFLIFNGFLHLETYFQRSSNLFYSLLEQLGNSSYSLYLTHPFTLVLASYVCVKLHFTSPFLFITSLLTSSVLCGFFVYRFIEQPLSKWIRKRM